MPVVHELRLSMRMFEGYWSVYLHTELCKSNRSLIILIPTGDRNGSHVRYYKIDMDLFCETDNEKMCLLYADTVIL